MSRKFPLCASMVAALVVAGLLLALARPAALGSGLYQATATLGLPTRPGLTLATATMGLPTRPALTGVPTMFLTAMPSPTAVVTPTAAPLPPTVRPTHRATEEPPATATPLPLPDTPLPTVPPALLPAAGAAQLAWPWWVLVAGLALLIGAALLRRRPISDSYFL